MAALSAGRLASLVQGVGFSRTKLHDGNREDAVMVAIILGESGGDPRAHNTRPPDNSYGLAQINMYGNLGPERRRQFGITSNDALFDPVTNVRAARRVFLDAGSSFRPWSVFTNGTYKRHLSTALRAVGSPTQLAPEGIPIYGLDLPSEAADDFGIGDLVEFFTSGRSWLRIAQFVGGGVLIIVAVVMFTGRAVTDVLPVKTVVRAVAGGR